MSIDHKQTDEVTCPYCGYKYDDSFDMGNGGELECDECEKEFSFESEIITTYSTFKAIEPV